MHPSYEIERQYSSRILGKVTDETLEKLTTGVMLEDGKAKFTRITFAGGEGANRWYNVALNEGRNREVRRLWESQDLIVSRLRRISYGGIELKRSLKPGNYEDLNVRAMRVLYERVKLELDEENFLSKTEYSNRKERDRKFKYGSKAMKKNKTKRR
jgi:23S rRNA pseudouridine2605 synthase